MHFSTILARSPAAVLAHISRLSALSKDHVLLFSLSSNTPSSDLAQLVQKLTTFSPQSIGCLSGPLPGRHDGLLSCSFAMFKSDSCFPFRSQIQGRASPQVGRRHSFRQKESQSDVLDQDVPSGNIDWGTVWNQSLTNNELPSGLQSASLDEIGTIVYFTDAAPEGLSNTLARFRGATKLGLFAASTPFITGRPVTLFKGDKIYEAGAVGLALKHPKANARVQFLGMEPLCPPMLVTQAEGNLVISLDNKNPTQLLLAGIRAAGIDSAVSSLKDNDEFALATLRGEDPHQMCTIMSGDPSRGTIALRSMSAPPIGARVQFFHRPRSTTVTIPQELTNPLSQRQTLGFMAYPETQTHQHIHSVEGEEGVTHIFQDTFLAASEGGLHLESR
ncbi:hypothetical protein MVEN_00408700 [Mycena venus]|uniref:FIST domain-containing protein n=1 Tax=Mycena venus TaxID=2733690 RepID=A0A8H7D8L2_9AGAR|nr:hypothetical protein MVEN_00408700 [Mycena venus]